MDALKEEMERLSFGRKAMKDKERIRKALDDLIAMGIDRKSALCCEHAPAYAKEIVLSIYDDYIISSLEVSAALRAVNQILEDRKVEYSFFEYMKALKKTARPYEYLAEYDLAPREEKDPPLILDESA